MQAARSRRNSQEHTSAKKKSVSFPPFIQTAPTGKSVSPHLDLGPTSSDESLQTTPAEQGVLSCVCSWKRETLPVLGVPGAGSRSRLPPLCPGVSGRSSRVSYLLSSASRMCATSSSLRTSWNTGKEADCKGPTFSTSFENVANKVKSARTKVRHIAALSGSPSMSAQPERDKLGQSSVRLQ